MSLFRSSSSGLCGFSFLRVAMVSFDFFVFQVSDLWLWSWGLDVLVLDCQVFLGCVCVHSIVSVGRGGEDSRGSVCSVVCTILQAASARLVCGVIK